MSADRQLEEAAWDAQYAAWNGRAKAAWAGLRLARTSTAVTVRKIVPSPPAVLFALAILLAAVSAAITAVAWHQVAGRVSWTTAAVVFAVILAVGLSVCSLRSDAELARQFDQLRLWRTDAKRHAEELRQAHRDALDRAGSPSKRPAAKPRRSPPPKTKRKPGPPPPEPPQPEPPPPPPPPPPPKKPRIADGPTPYELLGVPRSASEAEIRAAYKRKAAEWHPDRMRSKSLPDEMLAMAEQRLKDLNAARDRLLRRKK